MARKKQTARKSTKLKKPTGGKGSKNPVTKSKPPGTVYVERAYGFRSGIETLQDIHRYQTASELSNCRAPFARLVREIMDDFKTSLRMEREAVQLLQVSHQFDLKFFFSKSIKKKT